jgi:hypothetical protein
LSLLLFGGNAVLCEGWAATPEARMACCSGDDACPMHDRDSHGPGSGHGVTQAQADACCAVSERDRSSQPNQTSVPAISSAVLGTGVIVSLDVPALIQSHTSRAGAPVPVTGVPRHVLLSVFLV